MTGYTFISDDDKRRQLETRLARLELDHYNASINKAVAESAGDTEGLARFEQEIAQYEALLQTITTLRDELPPPSPGYRQPQLRDARESRGQQRRAERGRPAPG